MKPKKSLGQNFLKEKEVLQKIIDSAHLETDDFVVEIGPGEGIMTEEMAKHAGTIVAVEIDSDLASQLDRRFRGNAKIKIINDDILKINLPELIEDFTPIIRTKHPSYKVIANIPYYITAPIIQLFLETKYLPQDMVIMVQKEVAERIVAKPGKMSLLAISIQYYAKAQLLFYVNKKSFYPVPKVDSAVIRITPNQQLKTGNKDETRHFFQVVRAGFSSKRKMLSNNLANSLHMDKKVVEEKLGLIGKGLSVRAQELSVDDWKKLSVMLVKTKKPPL